MTTQTPDTATNPTPAAGWYPDSSQPGTERWYDGAAWTEHTRPTGAPAIPAPPAPPARPTGADADAVPAKKKKSKKGLIVAGSVLAGVLAIAGIGSAVNGGADTADEKPASSTTQVVEEQVAMTALPDVVGQTATDATNALIAAGVTGSYDGEPDAKVIGLSTPAGTEVEVGSAITLILEEKPALTLSQENAIDKAQSYLDFSAFSHSGLIDQLVFEDFSVEDATFAVEYIAVDWNEQAAKKAQSYLDFSSFSRQGLIDQLTFEGFSAEQAEYGVTQVGF
jgi:flagellar basal body-associated protein FliL